MSDNTQALVSTGNTAQGQITNLNSGVAALYSSVPAETIEDKMKVLNYVTNPEPVVDHLNETLNLRHIIAQAVEITDEKTGESSEAVRVILVTEDEKAYSAVSKGLFTYLRNLFDIVGQPSEWGQALPIRVVEKRGRNGYRFMTVELASAAEDAAKSKQK